MKFHLNACSHYLLIWYIFSIGLPDAFEFCKQQQSQDVSSDNAMASGSAASMFLSSLDNDSEIPLWAQPSSSKLQQPSTQNLNLNSSSDLKNSSQRQSKGPAPFSGYLFDEIAKPPSLPLSSAPGSLNTYINGLNSTSQPLEQQQQQQQQMDMPWNPLKARIQSIPNNTFGYPVNVNNWSLPWLRYAFRSSSGLSNGNFNNLVPSTGNNSSNNTSPTDNSTNILFLNRTTPNASAIATHLILSPIMSINNMLTNDGYNKNIASSNSTMNSFNITFSQFQNAVTSNGFESPTIDQYNLFLLSIPSSGITSKRELAMFMAQLIHESAGLTAKEEFKCLDNGCPDLYDYSFDKKHHYYGRGYIQLTWSYNYMLASQALYGNPNVLLNDPESVAIDEDKAWRVTSWFWNENVHSAPGVMDGYFGASTRAINGDDECYISEDGIPDPNAKLRFTYYTVVLKAFEIDEVPIESGCYN